jgi:transposase
VIKACRKVHVGRGTFYYWRPRFDDHGYAGLAEFASRAPKEPSRTAPEIEAQVIQMCEAHPSWGKQRIADELAKGQNCVPLVSPNTVKRILQDAGLWPAAESGAS